MKRPSSLDLDSLAGNGKGRPFAICSSSEEVEEPCGVRTRSFPSMLEGVGEDEEEVLMDGDDPCSPAGGGGGSLALGEKKRRLSAVQVKALERNFEVENKLEPDRKVKLAHELGLQPRQVAVWFQNRRARWKTKQLERDYGLLKAEYDELKVSYDGLHHDKEALLAEIEELKAKLALGAVKEEPMAPDALVEQKTSNGPTQQNFVEDEDEEELPAVIYKDGSSDSDSSAILNDESCSPSGGIPSIPPQLQEEHQPQLPEFVGFSYDSPASTSPFQFQFADGKGIRVSCYYYEQGPHPLQRSAEEQGILCGEELCGSSSFLEDDQPSSLYWYTSDQWAL